MIFFSLVHDVLSDEELSTETSDNKNLDTNIKIAFNVFPTSDENQNEPKNK